MDARSYWRRQRHRQNQQQVEPCGCQEDVVDSQRQRLLLDQSFEHPADLIDRGLVLAGGGSLLRGFDKLISEETGLPVHIADDPLTAVALGTGRYLSDFHLLKRLTVNSNATREY